MKTINETFTEDEFRKLKRAKKKADFRTWHEFMIGCADKILAGEEIEGEE